MDIKLLAVRIPSALRPQFINNSWRKPRLSLRKQADVRKRAIASDKFFVGADLTKHEWDPRWDKPRKSLVMRRPNGPMHMKNRGAKMELIAKNMEEMPARVKKMREDRLKTKPKTDFDKLLIEIGLESPPGASGKKQKKGPPEKVHPGMKNKKKK